MVSLAVAGGIGEEDMMACSKYLEDEEGFLCPAKSFQAEVDLSGQLAGAKL